MLIINEYKACTEESYHTMPDGILIGCDLDKNGNVRIMHMDNEIM